MKKRLLCLFLTLALLLTVLLPAFPVAQAAKQEKTRAIGIVFDNSGSMYTVMSSTQDNRKAWCRATYAAEAFASMMNQGDILQLYPMNPITLGKGGKEYTRENPLVIQGPDQSETIRQIYTPWAGDTPFQTVTAAYQGLMKTDADEKYLIILTDGKFEEAYVIEDMDNVNSTLDQYSRDVQVMYLGLGVQREYTPTESDPSRQHYVKADNTSAVLTELTAMCNQIFGRDLLPLSGNTASFDVSMSKLIVFIQGENISDVTLGGKKPNSQHATKYSELGCEEPDYDWQVDDSLQGVIATFEDFDAGSYELSYSGNATSTSIYYEPDVDLAVELTDANGNPAGKEIYAGTYTLNYSLVDKNGEPTESDLLGDTLYSIHYQINGEDFDLNESGHGSVQLELAAGDKLDGEFSVSYLKDYTIRKDAASLGWPAGGYEVVTRPVGQVTAKVEGGQDVYPLSQLEELAVYDVSVFCEGEQITGEDLERAGLQVEITDGNTVPRIQKTDTGFTVTLTYSGSAADTKCGFQSADFLASYTNVDGQTGNADPISRGFEIQDDSSSLKAKIQLEQSYYMISKLEEAAPIRFKLTAGGEPLSAEAFAATTVKVDMGGLLFDLVADPQSSSYVATLQPGQEIEPAKYTVTCTAEGFDEIGRPVTATDSAKIECRSYPIWLPWLIAALILLGLLIILWIIMNTKVLPKKILLNDDVVFTVRGKEIPGAASCSYGGGNKKKGSLRIQSPSYIPNPAAQCGLSLTLNAISPRRTKSRSRFAQVTRVTAQNPATTTSIMIGGFQMEKDPATGALVAVGSEPNAPVSFRIGNNIDFEIVSKVPDGTGRRLTCTLSGTLRFM